MNVLNGTSNKNFTRASDVQIPSIYERRYKTGKEDLDKIFGGSIMPNVTFTLAAAPGTGKTTAMLQMLDLLEQQGKRTAYISGEEGVVQLAFSCKRLGVTRVPLANITDIDEIVQALVENSVQFAVIDSLPALTSKKKMNKKQLEEYITTKLIQTAKENEIAIGVILHFTKSGVYKGGTLYPHSCDMNVIMTRNKEDYSLRDVDVTKNRFGSSEQMVFEMTSNGFTFEAVESTESNQPNKKVSKADMIIQTLSEQKTMAQIVEETGVSGSYLTTLMRDLVNQGRITKTGRGVDATYNSL
jgi:DNA repair protein RadA/Sms